MHTFSLPRRVIGVVAVALVVIAALGGVFLYRSQAASAPATVILPDQFSGVPAGGQTLGNHPASAQMAIALVLRPQHEADLNNLMAALYNPRSALYHHWLAKGEYNARFAPSAAQVAQVKQFLTSGGLRVEAVSPFLIHASGTAGQIASLFRVHIVDFAKGGSRFFTNDRPVSIPATLASVVTGVMGLHNTAREHPHYIRTDVAAKQMGRTVPHYGAGPGGSGLTPSQTSSLYGASSLYAVGAKGQGAGRTLAVFELSGYTRSDIAVFEHTFFGSHENVGIVDVNVDGGPLTPSCPTGDICNPPNDYSGDVEVEADIEQQIGVAPKINGIIVYNAPNDFLGLTAIDEYAQIANDDFADSISSSWGLCEQDAGTPQILAEENYFRQMAAQGQSMFAAAGDQGAYDCLLDGTPNANDIAVDDPSSDPYVVSVGGTSFGTYDPQGNLHPSYPSGHETVWNPLGLCRPGHLNDCANFGAGGGGNSVIWGRPGWQSGPGVNNAFNTHAPSCLYNEYRSSLSSGFPCRGAPDVSANADEFTPYAEYCTGNPSTNSNCAGAGWFGVGGTSLSSPLWAGIISLWDSFHGARYGNAAEDFYQDLFSRSNNYATYFHDIPGVNQNPHTNGFFPVTPNYDEATGIGSPQITGIAESHP